jgi:membrane-bound ClpP family serine protease
MEWFAELGLIAGIVWGVFLFSATIFTLQNVLAFMGGDHGEGSDFSGDLAHHPGLEGTDGLYGLYWLRAGVNFLMGTSGVALSLNAFGFPMILALPIGAGAGVLFAWLVVWLYRIFSRLEVSGNISLREAVGHAGTVTVLVPTASEGGYGKVKLSIGGRVVECEASSDAGSVDHIRPGERVKVNRVSGSRLFVTRA